MNWNIPVVIDSPRITVNYPRGLENRGIANDRNIAPAAYVYYILKNRERME